MLNIDAIARELVARRLAAPVEAVDLLASHGHVPTSEVAEIVRRANTLLARAHVAPF